MIANKARRTAANLAKEFKDPAYPRQEMIRPTEQELEDGAQPYQQPRFLPQDLKFFEINDTHSMAPTVAHMFQILTTPRVLVVYSQPWKRNICFALEGSSLTTFTDANVRPFLHNFCSGALAPIDKTQAFAIPPPNGSLQKINGQSFSDVVMDDSKDVLVYYHTRISNQSEGASGHNGDKHVSFAAICLADMCGRGEVHSFGVGDRTPANDTSFGSG